MGLYQLEQLEVFTAKEHDTLCMVAWSASTILISFRGTVTKTNVVNDMRGARFGQSWLLRTLSHMSLNLGSFPW